MVTCENAASRHSLGLQRSLWSGCADRIFSCSTCYHGPRRNHQQEYQEMNPRQKAFIKEYLVDCNASRSSAAGGIFGQVGQPHRLQLLRNPCIGKGVSRAGAAVEAAAGEGRQRGAATGRCGVL